MNQLQSLPKILFGFYILAVCLNFYVKWLTGQEIGVFTGGVVNWVVVWKSFYSVATPFFLYFTPIYLALTFVWKSGINTKFA